MKHRYLILFLALALAFLPVGSVFAKTRWPLRPAFRTSYLIRTEGAGEVLGTNINKPALVYNVPAISQAPRGNWRDAVYKDACEETSALMAMNWIEEKTISTPEVETALHNIAAWEVSKFGFHQDTSAADTARILSEYFFFPVQARYDISTADILQALETKSIVIVPINGEVMYQPAGPSRHMILVVGFDYASDRFIINDPIQKNNTNLYIQRSVLEASLRDYPSGIHRLVTTSQTAMVSVSWPWVDNPQ